MRDQRKNFDDYAREKTSEFNQEHRAYSKKYEELKKEKEDAKKKTNSTSSNLNSNASANSGPGLTNEDIDEAFRRLKNKAADPLEPGQ